MTFWQRYFREIEVSADARSSLPFDESVEKFLAALKQARLKIPARIDAADISRKVSRSWRPVFFGSGSIFRGEVTRVDDGLLHLHGVIGILQFARIYFQLFLFLAAIFAIALVGGAAWRWFSIFSLEHRSDFVLLGLAVAGFPVFGMLVIFVKFLATMNYLSTRSQKDKIIAAFKSLEALKETGAEWK